MDNVQVPIKISFEEIFMRRYFVAVLIALPLLAACEPRHRSATSASPAARIAGDGSANTPKIAGEEHGQRSEVLKMEHWAPARTC
jgi:hypothetical protein